MDIARSVETLLRHREGVSERFYALLFDRHPELRAYFDGVDLAKQARKLQDALLAVQWNYTKGLFPNRNYLRTLGPMHRDMGVAPEQFRSFVEVLVLVLAEFHGPEWDAELRRAWNEALSAAVDLMLEAYDARDSPPPSEDDGDVR